ncbi:MAG: sulfite exporter TauE/SafE family protein [Burkholderiaceae bacterium]
MIVEAWLPEALSPTAAVGLVLLSALTSAFTATFGIGGGVALITVLLMILPPAAVLPLHGVVQAGSNAGRAAAMARHVRWPIAGWFTLGAVLGVSVGAMVFVNLPSRWLLGVLAVFILWSLWAPRLKASALPERGYAAVGALATFLTLFLGATGPLVAAFWDPARLGRHGVVATHAAAMTVQHALKVMAFGYLGFAFGDWLPLIAAMIASGFVGTLAGKWLLGRLPEAAFASIYKWVLTGLAVRLLVSAVFGA